MKSFKEQLQNLWQQISRYFRTAESIALEAVQQSPEIIKEIMNPSEKIQMAAIEKDISMIKHIDHPTENVQLTVIEKDASMIRLLKNPSEKIQMAAIRKDASVIRHIVNPTEKVKLETVKSYPEMVKHINNPSEDIQLAAVQTNPTVIQYIKNPTEMVQQTALMLNSQVLKNIENIQVETVKKNPLLIQNIPNPSETVQLTAVKANPLIIQFINSPSENVQIEAVKLHPSVIQYIKEPSEKVQLTAIKGNPSTIQYIESPNPTVSKAAFESVCHEPFKADIENIENFSDKVKSFFAELSTIDPSQIRIENSQFYEDQMSSSPLLRHQSETNKIINSFKKEIETENEAVKLSQEKIQLLAQQYQNLGYKTLYNEVSNMKPGDKKEIAVCSSKGKDLFADVSIRKDSTIEISNYRIKEKSTGLTEPLDTKGIDISKHPSSEIKKLLSGEKIEASKGSDTNKLLGLTKGPAGWGFALGKKAFQSADASAEV